MYIDSLRITNFRTFQEAEIYLTYKNRKFTDDFPKPKLPNVNLLLGDNGLGKTTLLKAISLAALGPAVSDSGIYPYHLIRREPGQINEKINQGDINLKEQGSSALIEARFTSHPQDRVDYRIIESRISITRQGDLEKLRWTHPEEKLWHPIYSSETDALFFVGYGATRRVKKREQTDISNRNQSSFIRAQRVMSLFEEAYSLLPLSSWLPSYQNENPGRYKQVVTLLNKAMGKDQYKFTGEFVKNEFIFERGGLRVPFPALSDGYRAYLGWLGDLLYHICMTCPTGSKLVDNHGIVMVDEIDLHIHPKWQLTILPALAKVFPNIQFIVTSHSPLVVGSLEWMNIILMKPGRKQSSTPTRIKTGVHGLDADQILLTDFFGLKTTRVPAKEKQLQELTNKARQGDVEAAKELMSALSKGME